MGLLGNRFTKALKWEDVLEWLPHLGQNLVGPKDGKHCEYVFGGHLYSFDQQVVELVLFCWAMIIIWLCSVTILFYVLAFYIGYLLSNRFFDWCSNSIYKSVCCFFFWFHLGQFPWREEKWFPGAMNVQRNEWKWPTTDEGHFVWTSSSTSLLCLLSFFPHFFLPTAVLFSLSPILVLCVPQSCKLCATDCSSCGRSCYSLW